MITILSFDLSVRTWAFICRCMFPGVCSTVAPFPSVKEVYTAILNGAFNNDVRHGRKELQEVRDMVAAVYGNTDELQAWYNTDQQAIEARCNKQQR